MAKFEEGKRVRIFGLAEIPEHLHSKTGKVTTISSKDDNTVYTVRLDFPVLGKMVLEDLPEEWLEHYMI